MTPHQIDESLYTPMMPAKNPKPILGLIGGIGAGKSFIASLFAKHGCAVIDSDALAHEVLQSPPVKQELTDWLGQTILAPDGSVSRRTVGRIVFNDPAKLQRLNALIHPLVNQRRADLMVRYNTDPRISAVVWDSPLLLESGLDREFDAVAYVSAPPEVRMQRLAQSRGWTPDELQRREKLQFPLDKKASVADYYIDNGGDKAASEDQVLRVISQFMKKSC